MSAFRIRPFVLTVAGSVLLLTWVAGMGIALADSRAGSRTGTAPAVVVEVGVVTGSGR